MNTPSALQVALLKELLKIKLHFVGAGCACCLSV